MKRSEIVAKSYTYIRNVTKYARDGQCQTCGARELATKTMCTRCRDYLRKKASERRERFRQAGLCLDGCGRPQRPGRTKCAECAKKNGIVSKKRRRNK